MPFPPQPVSTIGKELIRDCVPRFCVPVTGSSALIRYLFRLEPYWLSVNGHIESHYSKKTGKWTEPEFVTDPYLKIHGMSPAINYGMQAFEGMKAFRKPDGNISIFRPNKNAQRLAHSSTFISIPPVPEGHYVKCCELAVAMNAEYVPPAETGASMYIRPLVFGSSAQLGLNPPQEYVFVVYVMPTGTYHGAKPVDALIMEEFDRSAPHGTGSAKLGGNYAPVFPWSEKAYSTGFGITLHLDSKTHTEIDEFSTSGFIGVKKVGDSYEVAFPSSPTIIASVTSDSIYEIAKSFGWKVERRPVKYEELSTFTEVMAAGTAASLVPIRSITMKSKGDKVTYDGVVDAPGPICAKLLSTLRGIQTGNLDDTFGWRHDVKEPKEFTQQQEESNGLEGLESAFEPSPLVRVKPSSPECPVPKQGTSRLSPFAKHWTAKRSVRDRPLSFHTTLWPSEPTISNLASDYTEGSRKPKHVPIEISHSIIQSVLREHPSIPDDLLIDRRPSLPTILGAESHSPRIRISKTRHVPIVIPAFAQPYGLYPGSLPIPAEKVNTPKFQESRLKKQAKFEIPYPRKIQPTCPTIDSILIKSFSVPVQPENRISLNVSSEAMATSQPDPGLQVQDSLGVSQKAAGLPSQSQSTSPAIHQTNGSTSAAGPTNLSGLVCNVRKTTGREPHARVGATTTILGDKLYTFGGRVLSRRPRLTADLYELDLIRRHWTKLETSGDIPAPRYFHSTCALGDTKLVCYGGMSPAPPLQNQPGNDLNAPPQNGSDAQPEVIVMSDIHVYDVPSQTWTRLSVSDAPQGRYAHCAAILPSTATFTSSSAPMSAIHHNPSSSNPNQGSIGVALDGAGGAEMIVVGGQDSANHYIEEMSVFNFRSLKWTATNSLGRSCGAYRSIVSPLLTISPTDIGKRMRGGDPNNSINGTKPQEKGCSMLIYSNYNFLDVQLELQLRSPDGNLMPLAMQGQISPPGLRFPNGGVLDNHFVISGTHLTSSKQEYALWALDLKTLTWSRIEGGSGIFSQGSWNRGILWNRRNTFVILGNRRRSLVEDYNHRRINFSHICMVELEAFGLYENSRSVAPMSNYTSVSAPTMLRSDLLTHWTGGGRVHSQAAQELGQMNLTFRELADMDLLAIGGERIPVNSRILSRRWGPYFIQLLHEGTVSNDGGDAATLRQAGSAASRNSAITITPSIRTAYSVATTLTANINDPHNANDSPPEAQHLAPTSRPRTLYLPHTHQTIQLLVHYLYTSTLPPITSPLCTPPVLCSILQIARPYEIDGLLEATVERLHQVLDGRNAAALFNAAAMAAGGGRGTGSGPTGTLQALNDAAALSLSSEPAADMSSVPNSRSNSVDHTAFISKTQGLRINTSLANKPLPPRGNDDEVASSAGTNGTSASSVTSSFMSSADGEERQVWSGELSSVVGLQKRGLRGLMEGKKMRERGRSQGAGGREREREGSRAEREGSRSEGPKVGLGIA
ncbi:MAG: hypothetical protein M1834_006530 [Cirrosporium novae-zelandiae]|nr:MAG: hypothetical protein M1834_006530 [Cirrosporium novae-zelandiae]